MSTEAPSTEPNIVDELHGSAVVFYTDDPERGGGRRGVTFAGGLLPRGTYPYAVMGADGSIVSITDDQLPDTSELAALLDRLRGPARTTLTEHEILNFVQAGDLVAIDISGSAEPDDVRRWIGAFAGSRVDIVLFDHEVRPYSGGPVDPFGMSSPKRLIEYIEELPTAPRHVFVFTDGCTSPAVPADPDLWTWVLPTNGMDWVTARHAGKVVYIQ